MIPVLDRLALHDYVYLLITFIFFVFESALRILLGPLIHIWPRKPHKKVPSEPHNVYELVASWNENIQIEDHIVETRDGYMLGIHRLVSTTAPASRPVVLLWHGFMMSSEGFLCRLPASSNLAYMLLKAGYDVWLGNTRGNKYSYKHTHKATASNEFWEFSMDDLARFDVPDTIDYILRETQHSTLSYVGFSQGTAQMFAALSLDTTLNSKVDLFIALAPATRPPDLETRTIAAVVRASPDIIYLFIGRRRALSMALFWRDYLPSRVYGHILDTSMGILFGWKLDGMSASTRARCYYHLYSYTSVKLVVHWFQIIRAKRFQSYDDATTTSRDHVPYAFPTHRIKAPIAVFHGGRDALTNIKYLLQDVKPKWCVNVPEFEHLDFLWGDETNGVYEQVIKVMGERERKGKGSKVNGII